MISFRDASDAPTHEVRGALAAELVMRAFGADGWLTALLGLDHRPQQAAMAAAVADVFTEDLSLLFEAGTGVGKSLAYLVPGIIRAVETKRPLVVSSHTIALQQQLLHNDLPKARALFAAVPELERYRDFKAALMVGRANYLCGYRLRQALATKGDLFNLGEEQDLARIQDWAHVTEAGLREELRPRPSAEVWDWVNADSSNCNKKHCSPETCFYRRALAERASAHVIVVNHALLFSLIGAGAGPGENVPGVLFPRDFAVVDEAHTLPAIATDHLGLALSSYAIDRALKQLYHPKRNKGLLVKLRDRAGQEEVTRCLAASEDFFDDVRGQYLAGAQSVRRLSDPAWAEPLPLPLLTKLSKRLLKLRQDQDDQTLQDELADQAKRIQGLAAGLTEAVDLQQDDHVYWLERTGRSGSLIQIRSAPLDVADALRERLFDRGSGLVLTSATLDMGTGLETFAGRVGGEEAQLRKEASPFDYARNLGVFIAGDAPEPSRQNARLNVSYLTRAIARAALVVPGGTLVLFTSYADLHAVYDELQPTLEEAGRPLLAQGRERSRSDLKEAFVAAGNAVLLGAESFWTGFDVPGSALSQVILTRLPFEPPNHPVAEARAERIRAKGGNPFAELTLPEAVLKFRQGIGRLIRGATDRGIIFLLDSRVLRKSYGKTFLQALPKNDWATVTQADWPKRWQPPEGWPNGSKKNRR
ncbi:MAG: ATP-dependent DNA helicase [Opitutales bacterium]